MNIAYRFRIYPTEEQKILLGKTFGCCRFLYNQMLNDKIREYAKTKKMLKNTPAMYKKEYPFLKEIDSLALANVQLHLEKAYKNFFRDSKIGFPRFKTKHHSKNSYTTNVVNGNILVESKKIRELEESKNSFFRYEGLKLYLFWGGMVCNILVFLMLLYGMISK